MPAGGELRKFGVVQLQGKAVRVDDVPGQAPGVAPFQPIVSGEFARVAAPFKNTIADFQRRVDIDQPGPYRVWQPGTDRSPAPTEVAAAQQRMRVVQARRAEPLDFRMVIHDW